LSPEILVSTIFEVEADGPESGPKLGGVAGDRNSIVTISAGGNSSIAAALNSDVWQWGELNSDFKADDGKDKKHKASSKDKEAAGGPVPKAYPFKVASWKAQSFRTQMRKDKDRVSISETLCMVMDKDDMKGSAMSRIKDCVEEDKRWRSDIASEIEEKKKFQEARNRKGGDTKGTDGDADGGDLGDLQDTIAYLDRDIEHVSREIDMFAKNIMSCDQQQAHNRKQIEMLTHQATQLTESQGKYSQQMLDGKKSGQQKKQLETQLNEIKDFIEANSNTRATLLDQRAETDKEKQHLSAELSNRIQRKEDLKKRLEMVHYLGSSTRNSSGASDRWVGFLGKEKDQLTTHFEGKPLGNADILEAKKKLERDEGYVRAVEMRMSEMLQNSREQGSTSLRPEACNALLEDLVDLRRRLNDLMADKYFEDDLNFECFFKGAEKPAES
jgi:hypothetical protein